MTPAEYEWAQERLEIAYERGLIGRVTFIARMKELGFSAKACTDFFVLVEKKKKEASL